jgi:4-carboxymuconolactone decarboxylase
MWEELQKNQSVTDATYARALAKLGEQGVVDALGITGYYTLLAMVMNTARTPLPPGVVPPLAPLPR